MGNKNSSNTDKVEKLCLAEVSVYKNTQVDKILGRNEERIPWLNGESTRN